MAAFDHTVAALWRGFAGGGQWVGSFLARRSKVQTGSRQARRLKQVEVDSPEPLPPA